MIHKSSSLRINVWSRS